jgi:Ni/Co efflux regulator RcnB
MKKFIAALIAVSMIATPALAQRNDRQYGSYERYERYERNHHTRQNRGLNTTETIVVVGGLLALGSLLSKNNRRERETVVYQDYRTQVCQDVIRYNTYTGEPYVAGRNCWYQ